MWKSRGNPRPRPQPNPPKLPPKVPTKKVLVGGQNTQGPAFPTYGQAIGGTWEVSPSVFMLPGVDALAERLNLLAVDEPFKGEGIMLKDEGGFYDLVELIAALIPDEAS